MEIRIVSYTTDEYAGPFSEFTFRNLVTAWGYIGVHKYVYSELIDEEKFPVGRIPGCFITRAFGAFDQRKIDME